jgi:hypothetical protein
MAYEQRDNSGTLFKNDKREKDSHPNATGKAMIGGVMYYVSAWTKDGSKGKFQSLSFKPVDEAQPSQKQPAKPRAADHFSDMDDDLAPF